MIRCTRPSRPDMLSTSISASALRVPTVDPSRVRQSAARRRMWRSKRPCSGRLTATGVDYVMCPWKGMSCAANARLSAHILRLMATVCSDTRSTLSVIECRVKFFGAVRTAEPIFEFRPFVATVFLRDGQMPERYYTG